MRISCLLERLRYEVHFRGAVTFPIVWGISCLTWTGQFRVLSYQHCFAFSFAPTWISIIARSRKLGTSSRIEMSSPRRGDSRVPPISIDYHPFHGGKCSAKGFIGKDPKEVINLWLSNGHGGMSYWESSWWRFIEVFLQDSAASPGKTWGFSLWWDVRRGLFTGTRNKEPRTSLVSSFGLRSMREWTTSIKATSANKLDCSVPPSSSPGWLNSGLYTHPQEEMEHHRRKIQLHYHVEQVNSHWCCCQNERDQRAPIIESQRPWLPGKLIPRRTGQRLGFLLHQMLAVYLISCPLLRLVLRNHLRLLGLHLQLALCEWRLLVTGLASVHSLIVGPWTQRTLSHLCITICTVGRSDAFHPMVSCLLSRNRVLNLWFHVSWRISEWGIGRSVGWCLGIFSSLIL